MQTENALKPHRIERFKVDSSNVRSIGYHEGVLVVEFVSGEIYAGPFTPEQFEAFARAESKGSYFAKNIKGHWQGKKLTGMCLACKSAPQIIGEPCPSCGGSVVAVMSKREAARYER